MAKKGAMPTFKTVDDYIANQKEAAQDKLKELRALIFEVAPQAYEHPNAKVPVYSLGSNEKKGQGLMMAAYAKYLSFYPFPDTVAAFEEELSAYKMGKGSVQFPYHEPLPKELLKRMIQHRMKTID